VRHFQRTSDPGVHHVSTVQVSGRPSRARSTLSPAFP
jgi:hypothetical protein